MLMGLELKKLTYRARPIYNVAMTYAGLELDKLMRHIDFDEHDVANLRSLGSFLTDSLDRVTDAFYLRLFADPQARMLFREGEAQIARQRRAFQSWLSDLFCGRYDKAYFQSRVAIGRTHVRIGMPQQYMFTAFEIVRQELEHAIHEFEVPEPELKMRSLDKLLTLETTMMSARSSRKNSRGPNISRSSASWLHPWPTRSRTRWPGSAAPYRSSVMDWRWTTLIER
jgi:truncated hemoglobin YjbI